LPEHEPRPFPALTGGGQGALPEHGPHPVPTLTGGGQGAEGTGSGLPEVSPQHEASQHETQQSGSATPNENDGPRIGARTAAEAKGMRFGPNVVDGEDGATRHVSEESGSVREIECAC